MSCSDLLGARSKRARSFTLIAALVTALGFLTLFVARADAVTPLAGSTSPLPGSSFQGGDGNQADASPYVDWQGLQGLGKVSHHEDPNAPDSIFDPGGTAKEYNPGSWSFGTANDGSNPKNENFFDAYSSVDISGDTFLNVAFTREATSGTAYLGFELDQRPGTWNNGSADVPCRTTGDVLATLQVNGNTTSILLETWTTSVADAATGCAKMGALAAYNGVVDNVDAQGAVNTGTIVNYLPESGPLPSGTIDPLKFGEASLNLSNLLEGALGTPCFSFGSVWMHSRSSTQDDSTLKDYIAPSPLLVRSCAASGVKFHDLDADGVKDAGEPGLAGFRMFADFNDDGIRQAGEPFGDTDASGAYVIAVKPIKLATNPVTYDTTYRIREELAPPATGSGGWTCSSPAGATGADGVPSFATGTGGSFGCGYGQIDVTAKPIVTDKDFGNYKAATIKVEKQTEPNGAAGSWAFTSNVAGNGAFALSDGDQKVMTVVPATYTATETLDADFNLTGLVCSGDTDSSGDTATRTATFRAQSGETITCVFTNTRKTGRLTVRKVLDPTTDPGKFDLRIGSDLVVDDGGNGAEATRTLPTGTGYTVSEADGAGTSLASYDSAVVCKDGTTTVASGTGVSLSGVPVVEGHDVICTFTNARRPGTITVVKHLVPAADAGTFDLKVGDTVVAPGAGDGGFGSADVAPGAYTVSEAGAAGTALAKYDSAIECRNGEAIVKSGSGTSLAGVAVDSNETIVCTITNTRRTGKLTLVKHLVPAADDGTFDLKIDAVVVRAAAKDGQGGDRDLAPGDYAVSETGAGATVLAKYDSSIACTNGHSGDGTSLAAVHVDSNDDITCTITNTRRKGSIKVVKHLVPAADAGTFDLKVGDTVVAPGAGDGGFGSADVAPGAYTVSEAAAAGTSLAHYDSAIECRNGEAVVKSGSGTSLAGVAVDSNETIVCTITNTRRASVTVTKTEAGNDPARSWTFRLTGGPDAIDVTKNTQADGNPLQFGDLKPGDYTLCEIDLPAGWHSSLGDPACEDLTLAAGDAKAVAVDNTKPGIHVVKTGPGFVHHGDTITYTFAVSNTGNTPLHDVTLQDDRCDAAPVRDAAHDVGSDGDNLLEGSEVWAFTCTKLVTAAHSAQEENPIVNVATAHGLDGAGNEVTDTGSHETTIIHPGIAVNKELRRQGDAAYHDGAPITVHRGDTIEYRFSVSNTGDTPLGVAFSDPKCDTQPVAPTSGDTDADGKLDVGETWIYRCDHVVTATDADPLDNTVTVTGTDGLGGAKGTVTGTDTERADIVTPDVAIDKQVRRLNTGEFVNAGLSAHVGDTLEYRFTVTDGASDTPIAGVALTDPRCDAGTLQGPVKTGGDEDALLEDGETWTYTCTHVITTEDPNPLPNTATVTGHDTLGGEVSDQDSTSVQVIHPNTLVVKEGNLFAYPGDTVTFTFAVSNNGDTPLHGVSVSDDRCAPVTGPTEKRNGNQDDLLDPGETWMFACSKQIPADHKIGDENPIRNVATATGKDDLDKTVTSTDDHLVKVLHPAVDIEKTGPATAAAGTPLGYTLTVKNPGDVPFAAQDVVVTDPRCEAPPAGPQVGADTTPNALDPGDTWTYTCTAQTTGQPAGTFVNTAKVDAKDFNGHGVTDSDDFPTQLTVTQQVLPERIISGTARLRGPSGCVKTAFKATVRGKRIAGVTFYVDGKKLKRLTAKRGQTTFTVTISPKGAPKGVHRVTAKVVFEASSRTRARTLRLSFQRCVRQVLRPRFTG